MTLTYQYDLAPWPLHLNPEVVGIFSENSEPNTFFKNFRLQICISYRTFFITKMLKLVDKESVQQYVFLEQFITQSK